MQIQGKAEFRTPLFAVEPNLQTALASGLIAAIYLGALARSGLPSSAIATVAVIGIAALVSGLAGFAFSAISGAILFHSGRDNIGLVEVLMVCSIANQALCVWLLRRNIEMAPLAPFVLGGLPGVPFGVWMLLNLNGRAFSLTLGVLLVAYGLTMLLRRPVVLRGNATFRDVAVGFAGGTIGGLTATPGAVISIWCGMKGWDRLRQRAVFQPFTVVMQIAALVVLAYLHGKAGSGSHIPALAWAAVPAGLLGTWWGMALFKRMRDDHFTKAVNLLLIVSGLALLV